MPARKRMPKRTPAIGLSPMEHAIAAERLVGKITRLHRRKYERLQHPRQWRWMIIKHPDGTVTRTKKMLGERWTPAEAGSILRIMERAARRVVRTHTRPLAAMAERDRATELYNKHEFEHRVAGICRNPAKHIAMLVIDLNDLKTINDTLGHEAGDLLISAISRAMKTLKHKKLSQAIGRLGGDEFGVIIPIKDKGELSEKVDSYTSELKRLFERNWRELLTRGRKEGKIIEHSKIVPSFSVGAANTFEEEIAHTRDGYTGKKLIGVADARMYRDKQGKKTDKVKRVFRKK